MSVKYSFIIPTKNEENYIKDCITSIKNLNVDKKFVEIIIVDSHSQDDTVRVAKETYNLRILYEKTKGPSAARNKGAKAANGEFLIFTDADVRFEKNFLENLDKIKGGCVFSLSFWDASLLDNIIFSSWNVFVRMMLKLKIPLTNGSCFAFKRSTFEEINGFQDSLLTNEDHDIARKSFKITAFEFCPTGVKTSIRRIRQKGPSNFLYQHFLNTKEYFLHGKSNHSYWD